MSDFQQAVQVVLKHEGGYNYILGDHGGPTNYGISLRYAKTLGLMLDIDGDGDVDIDDIKKLPWDKAVETYRVAWWDKYNYGRITNQLVATKVFDMAVNMGPKASGVLVQRACNSCGANLVVDGQLGLQSFGAINSLPYAPLLKGIKEQQLGFYQAIVRRDPTQMKFMRGWADRASWPQNIA